MKRAFLATTLFAFVCFISNLCDSSAVLMQKSGRGWNEKFKETKRATPGSYVRVTTVNNFTNKEVIFTSFFALIFVFQQLHLKCWRRDGGKWFKAQILLQMNVKAGGGALAEGAEPQVRCGSSCQSRNKQTWRNLAEANFTGLNSFCEGILQIF